MKLVITGLRLIDGGPLRDTRIEFGPVDAGPSVRVIGGANGCGKTTVLETIVGLLRLIESPVTPSFVSHLAASLQTGLPPPPPPTPDPPFEPQQSILARTVFAQLDVTIDDQAITLAYGKRPADYVLPSGAEEFHVAPGKSFLEQTYGPVTMKLIQEVHTSLSRKAELGFPPRMPSGLPSVLFFPHYRVIRPTTGDQVQRETNVYRWVHRFESINTFAGSLNSAFIWLEYAEPDGYAWLKELSDGLDLDGKTFNVDRKSLQVLVTTRGGATHPLEYLSSGEQNILVLAIELGRRLVPGSVVLIDEIENSLHPAFQVKLGQMLLEMQRRVPFQLIVTTHAPALLDVFGADRTLLLTEF